MLGSVKSTIPSLLGLLANWLGSLPGAGSGGRGRASVGREEILSVLFPCCSIPAAAVEAAGGGEKEECCISHNFINSEHQV